MVVVIGSRLRVWNGSVSRRGVHGPVPSSWLLPARSQRFLFSLYRRVVGFGLTVAEWRVVCAINHESLHGLLNRESGPDSDVFHSHVASISCPQVRCATVILQYVASLAWLWSLSDDREGETTACHDRFPRPGTVVVVFASAIAGFSIFAL